MRNEPSGAKARFWIRAGLAAALLALIAIPLATAAAVWAGAQPAPPDATPETENRATEAASTGSEEATDVPAPGNIDGARVFARACATCHGQNGSGRIGPELAGNENLQRADYVTAIILRGGDGMPAFHSRLSEAEVAAVTEYIRTSWGNDFGTLDEQALASRWWTGADDTDELYDRVCSRCHGVDGGGGQGPALAGNDNLSDAQYVAGKILHGQGGMPAFEGLLTSDVVQALASHVRTSFGNSHGPVDLGTVLSLHSLPITRGEARLQVSLFPPRARLTIVGPDRFARAFAGQPQPELPELAPGRYVLTVSLDDYETRSVAVDLTPGANRRVSLVLSPEGEPSPGGSGSEPAAEAGAGGEATSEAAPVIEPEGTGEATSAQDRTGATPLPLDQSRAFMAPPAPPAAVRTGAPDETEDTRQGAGWRALSQYQSSCALCHGPEGQGGIGPALAGNQNLGSEEFLLDIILSGTGRMPAFGHRLSNAQISAIATHERTNWGNDFGSLEPDLVAEQRGGEDVAPPPTEVGGSGRAVYERHCSICHGSRGAGLAAPGFEGNDRLQDISYVLSRVVMGGDGMPAFEDLLSTTEIGSVANYIRSAWGNDYGVVSLRHAQNYHGGASSLDAAD